MTTLDDLRAKLAKAWPFQTLPPLHWAGQRPTHADASPAVIRSALQRSARRPSGNWYVLGASRAVTARKPFAGRVAGKELVAWRDSRGALRVGPGECPHLGADLSTGRTECGALICPWHGLRLTGDRQAGWRPHPGYDDGVLVWVRLDDVGGETPTDRPVIVHRPPSPVIAAVAHLEGICEPADIIANRLDPWHGSWFHPYSFARLDVLRAPPATPDLPDERDYLTVAVTFRMGRLGVPVTTEFFSPEPRTILMRIVDGEGSGSVVETHATPLGTGPDGLPRTAVIEAVIAHSDRDGFGHATRAAAVLTPFMRYLAGRLWRDDLAYAERLFELRRRRTELSVSAPAPEARHARAAESVRPPTG
ncbi:DUF5914 domain-containing protein [Mycobacterium sp. 21AC1]|uniref:DUF5914 domain-containing protein n=1 Tax=[Mycobacterium] appelbergii TaxID=2939269 RepID=UPI002939074E|nr:DUF5914 domain-containing protein [Mycobacterium sp. 21AC1]MDV3127156.1 DUF5914 domain-containing protein [Mycobacterium sp. 21AC1]